MTRWKSSGWKKCKECKEEFFAARAKICPSCRAKKYSKRKRLRLKRERQNEVK